MKNLVLLFILSAAVQLSAEIRVACIGDSITFGHGIKERSKNSYPAQLQALLGKKYTVRNFGNSGRSVIRSSMRGRTKRAFYFMKEHQEAMAFKPHIVICNLGINDLMDYPKRSKEFVPDYVGLIEEYRSLKTRPQVILWNRLAPLFKGQKFYGSPVIKQINGSIDEVIAKLNGKADSSKPEIAGLDMETPLRAMPAAFKADKIHPDASGAKVIAEVTAKALQKLRR